MIDTLHSAPSIHEKNHLQLEAETGSQAQRYQSSLSDFSIGHFR